ncbi:glycosyltransferase, group 1 family protein [Leptospira inadai serovar Lyme str. 10]|uniref:Glycosyltransferase, group 1 family protein n=2 Tax=Leptospira inadai serovar Lyme TaxID=293084 RepID=V6HB72_9LEPT|nr:glycosyltransferase family 1 protein [Leptospira inadai]EQA35808.1 glycosyltransferase, group 1 family protein [Leptospira inadai serovar Lyme str. 10]PNV76892.1 glycosyl transferase [Leptospira inadai serovar Lyme]
MIVKDSLKYKPRIAVDVRPLAYGINGNSRYLAEILQRVLNENSPLEYYLYSNKPVHPVFHEITKKAPVFIPSRLPGLFWLNLSMPSAFREHRIDIFWGTLQLLPIFGRNIPMAVNYHDLNFHSAPETMTTANYWQHRFFSPLTLKRADKIFCLSKNTQREIAEFLPSVAGKLQVVYPGAQGFENVVPPNKILPKNFLFSVGTLEPRKNLNTLLEAYRTLKRKNLDYPFSLVLAGRLGWKSEGLTEILRNGSLESEGIFFIENPSDGELGWLYKNCSYFMFPSLHEGFGLPLLEAIQEEKPCIASDIPVFHEVLDSQIDLFVPPKDTEAWIKAMLEAGDRGVRLRDGKSRKWSWDSTAQEVEEGLVTLWKNRKRKPGKIEE